VVVFLWVFSLCVLCVGSCFLFLILLRVAPVARGGGGGRGVVCGPLWVGGGGGGGGVVRVVVRLWVCSCRVFVCVTCFSLKPSSVHTLLFTAFSTTVPCFGPTPTATVPTIRDPRGASRPKSDVRPAAVSRRRTASDRLWPGEDTPCLYALLGYLSISRYRCVYLSI